MVEDNPLKVLLVGCGAVSELYYAPALSALSADHLVHVSGLVDPSADRRNLLHHVFPKAKCAANLNETAGIEFDAAIVASPARFHAAQSIFLLERGAHVLCEKPLAASAQEAGEMIAASKSAQRLLAAGMFRRFFPTSKTLKELAASQALGCVVRFEHYEGGSFNWPAASPSFFQKQSSHGGVFADLGIHILDLIMDWFGSPSEWSYADDAMGGLESNCRLELSFPSGFFGVIQLSRDWAIPNYTLVEFEQGWIRLDGVAASEWTIGLKGTSHQTKGRLHRDDAAGATYHQSFVAQLFNFVQACRGEELLQVPAISAMPAISLIEQAYESKKPLIQPWLTEEELGAVSLCAS